MHLFDSPAVLTTLDASALLVTHLATVNGAVAHVARRRRLTAHEREDLASDTYVHLLRNDGAVLRSFRGRCALSTFLFRVVDRLLLDARTSRAGKWRPSARARRIGRDAVLLERAVHRDGLTLSEAAAALAPHMENALTHDELEFLFALLPNRPPHRRFDARDLERVPTGAPDPEQRLLRAASAPDVRGVARAFRRLPATERRILCLRFGHGLRLAEIARVIGLNGKSVYGRSDRALARLRASAPNAAR